jgi:TetR/AcrR family transcriptional regulator, transcriptional repressor for nem operon
MTYLPVQKPLPPTPAWYYIYHINRERKMRYDAEHKARTRERVLQEAVLAIRADGPERLGVAEVMKRAGLTHGGFYAHFESREALLAAAAAAMFETSSGAFERATRGRGAAEGLAAYLAFYLSKAHRDSRDWGCPLPILSGDLPRMPAATRERFAEGVARLTAAIAGKLRELGRPHAEAAASSALSEMIGALSVARGMGATDQSDEVLARARASIAARLGVEDVA